jgi:hypothetical protein
MVRRLRTTSFAGLGAVLLALIVSGMVAAASILTAVAAPEPDQVGPAVVDPVDTTGTFEDVNGDGIDDDCQDAVVAEEAAAAAAQQAVDLNGDGTISVSEAAQSDRTGGTNCNHGGYVSQVAHDSCDAAGTTSTNTDTGDQQQAGENEDTEPAADTEDAEAPASDCTTEDTQAPDPAQDQPPTCDAAPTGDTCTTDPTTTETTDTPKNHGAVVSQVAQSDAVGGKNCNHGGAVSEASHKDNDARKAARDAEKALRAAEKALRAAERAAKHAGKGHGPNH